MYLSHVHHRVWNAYKICTFHIWLLLFLGSHIFFKHLLNPENIRKQRNPCFRITAVEITTHYCSQYHYSACWSQKSPQTLSSLLGSLSFCKPSYSEWGQHCWGQFSPLGTSRLEYEKNCRICIGNCQTHSKISVLEVLTVVSSTNNILFLGIIEGSN